LIQVVEDKYDYSVTLDSGVDLVSRALRQSTKQRARKNKMNGT